MKLSLKTIIVLTWFSVSGINCNYSSPDTNTVPRYKTNRFLSFIKDLKLDQINSGELIVRFWYEGNQDKPLRELLVIKIKENDIVIKHYLITMESGYDNKIISKKYKVLTLSNESDEQRSIITSFCTRILDNKSTSCKQEEYYDGSITGIEVFKDMNYKFIGYKVPFSNHDLLCSDIIEFNKMFLMLKKEFDIFPIKNSTDDYIKY
jgi:hypothetical protein